MAISKFKKRYFVTLEPSVVERFQSLALRLGMPPSVMSNACNDALRSMADVFQIGLEKGTIATSDIMKLAGQQMELIEKEEKERKNVSKQKPDSVPNSKKHA